MRPARSAASSPRVSATCGHEVVGLDLVPEPEGFTGEWPTVDCADVDAVMAAFAAQPLDAVVHLAGIGEECPLPEALTSHVVTTAALLDAMVAHQVTRLVYASSNHAVGRTPRRELAAEPISIDASRAPTRSTASPRSRRRH